MTVIQVQQASISPSMKKLIDNKIPSRIFAQDASVYDFSDQAYLCAQDFMGWTQLASKPSYQKEQLEAFIQDLFSEEDELERVILIGEGGSSQAPMTVTKMHALEGRKIRFSTLDSLSPLYLHKILGDSDISKALIIVSSKSGTTLETLSLAHIIWDFAEGILGAEAAAKRFIAITDPGTKLEQEAQEKGWRAVFNGIPRVGGRFSALSVFGLVPIACVGMDVERYLKEAQETELACAQDSPDNPALHLACFLFDQLRNESACSFSFMSPQPARVLGLWIEQMIAESLGKEGKSLVPQIAIDPQLLNDPYPIRPVVTYAMPAYPEFEEEKRRLDPDVPALHFSINSPYDLGAHFVMWEYATAFLGYLMKLCPFDQPDVQSAKVNTSRALFGLMPNHALRLQESWLVADLSSSLKEKFEPLASISGALSSAHQSYSLEEILSLFIQEIQIGNWFALNGFLPFTGERRQALEDMRHAAAQYLGVPSCLEIGPRYLHSTGQLQKGGANTGRFLIISATEDDDILVPGQSHTLGDIIIAQAKGDLLTLSDKGRLALHLHLKNNHPKTLQALADEFEKICKRFAYNNN